MCWELAKVKMECDILKKALGLFAAKPSLRMPLLPGLANAHDVPCHRGFHQRLL